MKHRSFKKLAALFMLLSFIFATVSPAMADGSVWTSTNSATGSGIYVNNGCTNGNKASGFYSTAMGENTNAKGIDSTTMGVWTVAIGVASTAMGMATNAVGEGSTAMGVMTNASGAASTAMGVASSATGIASFAGGGSMDMSTGLPLAGGTAYGDSSFAFGIGAVAGKIVSGTGTEDDPYVYGGTNAISMGYGSWAQGDYSFSVGYQTATGAVTRNNFGQITGSTITDPSNNGGRYAAAMGYNTTAVGVASTAMGGSTTASGKYSTAMGYTTRASGEASTAMGCTTTAAGSWSTAMGYSSNAVGAASFAGGGNGGTSGGTAYGGSSFAFGIGAVAGDASDPTKGTNAISMGYGSMAYGNSSFAGGGDFDSSIKGGKAYGKSSFAFGGGAVAGKVISEEIGHYDEETGEWVVEEPAVYGGGDDAFALGNSAKAVKDNTIAFGSLAMSADAKKYYYGTYAHEVLKGNITNEMISSVIDMAVETAASKGVTVDIEALKTGTPEAFIAKMNEIEAAIGAPGFIMDVFSVSSPAPDGTTANGENAIAIGNSLSAQGTIASGKNSAVFGNDAKATAENALALGTNANASHANSVALGSNSVTTGEYEISVGDAANSITRKITNVKAGENATDAVNWGQILGSATYNSGTLTLKDNNGNVITTAEISGGGSGDNAVVYDDTAKTIVTFGDGTNNTKLAHVADGSDDYDAVNVKQLNAKADKADTLSGYGITDAYTKAEVDDKITSGGTGVIGGGKVTGKAAEAKADDAVALAGDSGVSENSTAGIAIGKGAIVGYDKSGEGRIEENAAVNSIAIGVGSKVTGANSIAVGTGHVITGKNSGAFGDPNHIHADNSYAIGNNNTIGVKGEEAAYANNFVLGSDVTIGKDAEGNPITNSVALGSGTQVTQSNTVAVGGRTISGLADGTNPTDAATVRQVDAVRNQLGSVSNEVREVGAISAALAGLHFVEPSGEEGDKLVGAVAYGGYRGSSAEAIGLAYKPSPNMMLSASTSISNGNDSQNAYNVGFSLKFGKGETAKTRAELQKQVKYLDEKNKAQDEVIQTLKNDNEAIRRENAEIKEMLKKLIKK